MKVKLKITIEQLGSIMNFVANYLNSNTCYSIEELNLRGFMHFGMKKIISLSEIQTPKNKIKTITFDVNMIHWVEQALVARRMSLDPYLTALYIDLQEQCRKQITAKSFSFQLIEY